MQVMTMSIWDRAQVLCFDIAQYWYDQFIIEICPATANSKQIALAHSSDVGDLRHLKVVRCPLFSCFQTLSVFSYPSAHIPVSKQSSFSKDFALVSVYVHFWTDLGPEPIQTERRPRPSLKNSCIDISHWGHLGNIWGTSGACIRHILGICILAISWEHADADAVSSSSKTRS